MMQYQYVIQCESGVLGGLYLMNKKCAVPVIVSPFVFSAIKCSIEFELYTPKTYFK